MSDITVELRALLADPGQAGAYYVDARDREALADAAQALGFVLARIDFDGCGDKDDALARIAQALDFPDWFGGNWDALADSLSDLSWLPAEGYVLLLEHVDAWRTAQPDALDTAIDILNQAAQDWTKLRTPFWALMPLPTEVLATMAD